MNIYEKKLNEIENKINNFNIKIEELEQKLKNNVDKNNKNDNNININDFDKLKKDLEELKASHEQTIIKVSNNKEQIEIILKKLVDIINGYKNGDDNLQKQIDDLNKKLMEITSQIDLLLQLPKGGGNNDLSALSELMKKIINLENDFKLFVEKVNIDEIYKQLKFLHETKADKKDLDDINGKIKKIEDKYDEHQIQIDAINKRLDSLFTQILARKNDGNEPIINMDLDFSKYLLKTDFDKFKKEANSEFKKIWDEIKSLKDLINKIFTILNTKANLSDFDEFKNFVLGKLDELAFACNKKFADKNDTTNNFKYLEEQLKKILELLSHKDSSSNDVDNWLLAKKPISGYSCAACESIIGNLRDESNKFIPWNKLPLRDPGDKLYRMGNGFSKMLQMLNFDNNGNVSLNPNIINEASINNDFNSRAPSAFSGLRQNNINMKNNFNSSNSHRSKEDFKKRIKSANPKFKINFKENKNKNNKNNFQNGNINLDLAKTRNEVLPDIYDISGTQNDDGPKITKVLKKPSKNQQQQENHKVNGSIN